MDQLVVRFDHRHLGLGYQSGICGGHPFPWKHADLNWSRPFSSPWVCPDDLPCSSAPFCALTTTIGSGPLAFAPFIILDTANCFDFSRKPAATKLVSAPVNGNRLVSICARPVSLATHFSAWTALAMFCAVCCGPTTSCSFTCYTVLRVRVFHGHSYIIVAPHYIRTVAHVANICLVSLLGVYRRHIRG